jgi:non-specific serine/threonine protein kinase
MGDRQEIAVATFWLGAVAADQGDLPAARAYVEESLVIAQEIRDKPLIATALNGLGEVARLEGAWADARKAYEQALGIWRQTANQYRLSIALRNLGATTWQDGDLSVASTSFREALAIDQKLGAKVGMALSLDGLAAVAGKRGASRRAARLAGAAQTLQHACGHRPGITDRAFRECYLAGLRVELGDVAFEAALAEGRALTLEQAVAEALEDIEA